MEKSTTPNNPFSTRLIFFTVLSVLIIRLIYLVGHNFTILTTSFDSSSAHQKYTHSQYNLDNAEFYGNIDDDLLYSYTGSQYIRGIDPSTINPEAPFLIKYLYGLSIHFVSNAQVIQLIFALSLLFVTYKLALKLTESHNLSLFASFILSFDPLFTHQTFHTLLDLPHALFITLALFTFINQAKSNSQPILTSVLLGLVATTKLYITAGIIYLVLIFFIPKTKKHFFNLTFPAISTYLLVHSIFFIYHPNPLDFFKLHLDTFRLYRSYLPDYPKGELLRIIFLGQWHTWWGNVPIISSPFWSPIWPLATISSLTSLFFAKKSLHKGMILISFVCLLYLLSNLTHVVFPRYILSILPILIISLLYSLQEVYFVYRHRRQRSQHTKQGR